MLPTRRAAFHELGLLTNNQKKPNTSTRKKEEKTLTYTTIEQLQENPCTCATNLPKPYSLTAI